MMVAATMIVLEGVSCFQYGTVEGAALRLAADLWILTLVQSISTRRKHLCLIKAGISIT